MVGESSSCTESWEVVVGGKGGYHVVAPVRSWYCPAEQSVHEEDPGFGAAVPFSHLVQFEARDPEYDPGSHTVQFTASPILRVPASHP